MRQADSAQKYVTTDYGTYYQREPLAVRHHLPVNNVSCRLYVERKGSIYF